MPDGVSPQEQLPSALLIRRCCFGVAAVAAAASRMPRMPVVPPEWIEHSTSPLPRVRSTTELRRPEVFVEALRLISKLS